MNTADVTILGDSVLVKQMTVEKVGMIHLPDDQQVDTRHGTVVALGTENAHGLKIGDEVILPDAGMRILWLDNEDTGARELHWIVKADDLLGVVER